MGELKQLSVFAENKPGKIEKITKALADAGINILAISISSSGDFGVIKFIVDKCDDALKKLKEAGFTASLNDVLGIELQDRPGGLHSVVQALGNRSINVENAHVFVAGSRDRAYLIIEVDDINHTRELLKNDGLTFYNS
ncbi:MAG: ACT domain-containing protein [Nitrospirae bacterium]|nr:ACT domain-containing protein [Nitrospirota bacterium]